MKRQIPFILYTLVSRLAAGRLVLLLLPLWFVPLAVSALTEQQAEAWLESDDPTPPDYKPVVVNEGVLDFLPTPPAKPVHHHHNILTIYPRSLQSGWVKLAQCHNNMDRVPLAQVVFNRLTVKGLRILKAEHIAKAWVDGASVQLEDVNAGAQLCIEARSRSLQQNPDGSYTLRNGPFMRKFLDGYYPLHVTVEVRFANTGLQLERVSPAAQAGFKVQTASERVSLDAWFEGRLQTELTFRLRPAS